MKRNKLNHSILFGDGKLKNGQFTGYDTYKDFHLIPTTRPTIVSPGVETKLVTIPGRDGSVDLSDFLRGRRPAYGSRGGTLEFYVENDYDITENEEEFWMTIYPKIYNTLHGKRFKMVLLEDDPDYYWEGRFTVDKYEAGDGSHSTVSISYALDPFKRKIRKNSEGMVWDNFNFERDYDYTTMGFENLQVTDEWSGTIWGDGCPFQLEVTCISGTLTVTFGGEKKQLSPGTTTLVGYAFYGLNALKIQGTGKVSIDWRGGSL